MSNLIIILGDKGSGKTLSAVRNAVNRHKKDKAYAYSNFPLKSIPHTFIRRGHFIVDPVDKKGKKEVNWAFWKEVKERHEKSGQPFDIYIDEAHNQISARNSMSKDNQLYTNFISQIRKIIGEDSGNSCYIISQTLRKIDVNFRELADAVVVVEKKELKDMNIHFCLVWKSKKLVMATDYFNNWLKFKSLSSTVPRHFMPHASYIFTGNDFWRYYDNRYIVEFQ